MNIYIINNEYTSKTTPSLTRFWIKESISFHVSKNLVKKKEGLYAVFKNND